ncbi:amidohydrolase [Bacillus sp. 165]|uniref:amidohydrolase n=1 Tax=Bacillus sp. 165 TaxID=1529117 RepID=UPI001ADA8772|nr:amidohydrolase [Bacillus sp. 165]MBO9131199.1 amidohydrolase [Bacillus sp. 165]
MGELWYGGKIYTMKEEGEQVESIYTEDGIIVAVGTKEALYKKYKQSIEKELDLQGGTMLPGLVDSHMHVIGHGERLMRLDLSACTSYKDMLEAVKKRVEITPVGEWIIGEGWNENQFTDTKEVQRFELDILSQEHPILLKRVCRHAMLVNSYVLEMAKVHEGLSPKGGKLGRTPDGVLNGLLYERAQDLLHDIIPENTEEYLEQALSVSIEDCWRHGLVGCHTEDLNYYGGFNRTYKTFEKVIKQQQRPFKAHLLVHHGVIEELQEYKETGTKYIEFGAMKIFADGSLGGRTALLSEPYTDMPSTNGVAVFEREELAALVKKARDLGLAVAVHAIGDLAFEYVVEAIETYPPKVGLHDRIIHCQVLREDLIQRAKELPVILDIQPVFVTADYPSVIEKLGEERMKFSYAWKTLMKEGFICAGGSDAPIESVNPFVGIYGAVARKSLLQPSDKVYGPHERLTMFEAVGLYTKGSASAIHRQNSRGMIAPGYEADFTILERDIFDIGEEELLALQVMKTVVDGIVVYEKN